MKRKESATSLAALGDDELLKRIADRDMASWGELVSRHAGAIFALAMTITRDDSSAADAV